MLPSWSNRSAGRPLAHWLGLAALVVMWGSSFFLNKVALAALAPTPLVAARIGIAALCLIAVVLVTGRRLNLSARHWLFFLAMAVVGNCLPYWLISWGQQRIDSGLAGILMAITPLSTIVLAHFLVADERLNPLKAIGFLFGFAGIVVLIGPEALLELDGGGTALVSELAVLGGAACYAVSTIIARHRPPGDVLVAAAGILMVGSLIMVPAALFDGPAWSVQISPAVALAVGALGLISTGIAAVVYLKLVTAAGASFTAQLNYLIPPYALIAGAVFLDEQPGWRTVAALALILLGIALGERGRSRAPDTGPRP